MQKRLAFTGHRPESLPFGENENDPRCVRLKAMLLTEIMDRAKAGYDTFYTGCARGMDIVFGRQVLLVKATSYPNIRLIGVVPHEGQANHWTETWRDRYFDMLEQADDVVTLSARYVWLFKVRAKPVTETYATKEGTSVTRQTGEVEWTAIKRTHDGRYQAVADEGQNGFDATKAATFLESVYEPAFTEEESGA